MTFCSIFFTPTLYFLSTLQRERTVSYGKRPALLAFPVTEKVTFYWHRSI